MRHKEDLYNENEWDPRKIYTIKMNETQGRFIQSISMNPMVPAQMDSVYLLTFC